LLRKRKTVELVLHRRHSVLPALRYHNYQGGIMLPRGNNETANRRIAVSAMRQNRNGRGFAKVDQGGGGGRIGTRVNTVSQPSKSDRLRPSDAS